MGLGNWIGRLLGGGSSAGGADGGASDGDPVEHEGYRIVPAPLREGGQFRTAGRIEREIAGELKSASFIRADNHAGRDAAIEHSVNKARQIIAEQGERLFDREHV